MTEPSTLQNYRLGFARPRDLHHVNILPLEVGRAVHELGTDPELRPYFTMKSRSWSPDRHALIAARRRSSCANRSHPPAPEQKRWLLELTAMLWIDSATQVALRRWQHVTLQTSGSTATEGPALTKAERHELWGLLAEHFLDTETRQEIPRTALRCVEVGCSRAEARDIWCYEVTPAVWANAWSVAGEWAGWNHDWLIERIEHIERERHRFDRFAAWAYLRYRLRVGSLHRTWTAIEGCMGVLIPLPPERPTQVAADLGLLADHYFSSVAGKPALASSRKAELQLLYDSTFLPIFEPLVVRDRNTGESPGACAERVARLLG